MNGVRHIPSLKKNLIFVGQLASLGHTTTFIGDMWKITKGALMISQGKKKGALYLTEKQDFIDVAETGVNLDTWHCRLEHISDKEMKILHSKDKLLRF